MKSNLKTSRINYKSVNFEPFENLLTKPILNYMIMKPNQYKIKAAFVVLCCLVFSINSSFAQYGGYGGYGGGYGRGGYGGYGGSQFGNQGFDNGKPKPPPDPDEVAKEETKVMVKKLKLDEEQEIIISSLNEDYAYQRKDLYERIKKDFGISKPTPAQIEEAKGQMKDLETRKEKELEKILTTEQFKAYMALKAKAEKQNGGGKGKKGT